ncbi:MAG TPA: GNAT family N-acetyltransferase [Chloroflexia bacterium]|nr:GNAT family N-acetyltransferase [Chloroflexia bacterium]
MTADMGDNHNALTGFHTEALDVNNWPDLERLFGARGACGGCWCMWWVLPRKQYDAQKGEANKQALRARVEAGEVPGLLGYIGDEPVAWCAVQPRQAYPALERSRTLARVDEQPVWSIVCLFVARKYRRKGISTLLLASGVEHAGRQGASIVEGYPVEPRSEKMPDAFAWTGTLTAFRRAGFVEVARRSETRPIVRYLRQATD